MDGRSLLALLSSADTSEFLRFVLVQRAAAALALAFGMVELPVCGRFLLNSVPGSAPRPLAGTWGAVSRRLRKQIAAQGSSRCHVAMYVFNPLELAQESPCCLGGESKTSFNPLEGRDCKANSRVTY